MRSRDLIDLRQIAACAWPRYSETVDAVNYNARYRAWLREHKPTMFESRRALHAEIQETLIGPQPITYLEFGVWEGKSLAMWAELNQHPKSCFRLRFVRGASRGQQDIGRSRTVRRR